MLLPLLLAMLIEMWDGCPDTLHEKNPPKLNHVVIMNYDSCACDKLNCYSVMVGVSG